MRKESGVRSDIFQMFPINTYEVSRSRKSCSSRISNSSNKHLARKRSEKSYVTAEASVFEFMKGYGPNMPPSVEARELKNSTPNTCLLSPTKQL
ncbi:hypothetical protein MUK42_05463 [Musa troglodytarum]|uniref:Uncharacterized protein n=1 Tax=Musa troglodytarum TaxID=320322 RepID=A0A9E7G980_9LILI|nr:hypothetical protein MUK42_05463 [Musa troglodytarum]